MDSRVDGIYRVLRGRIDLSNIVPTCIEVAQEVEQLQGMKGADKLAVLQNVLRAAVRDSKISITEKEELLHRIDTVVPIVVQAAILASKIPVVKKAVSRYCCMKK